MTDRCRFGWLALGVVGTTISGGAGLVVLGAFGIAGFVLVLLATIGGFFWAFSLDRWAKAKERARDR